jgi:hypothetical protein
MTVRMDDIRAARGQTNAGQTIWRAGASPHPDGDAIGGQVWREFWVKRDKVLAQNLGTSPVRRVVRLRDFDLSSDPQATFHTGDDDFTVGEHGGNAWARFGRNHDGVVATLGLKRNAIAGKARELFRAGSDRNDGFVARYFS